mgnify:CR=1 FL=1
MPLQMEDRTETVGKPAGRDGQTARAAFEREVIEHFAEISRALKIPRTTAFRLAQTLERLGFLEREGDGFRIGPAVMRLGLPKA